MANFHSSCKTVSRSAGRSATGAAAYRAGEKILDQRTGEIHDYQKKRGVESATLFVPDGSPVMNRAELWNAAEKAETRKNSTVAREWEIALPSELSPEQRKALAHEFTKALVKHFGFAADCAIHKPGKGGDSRNHHAHILCTTRKLTPEGFGEKTRVLDDHATGAKQVVAMREVLANLTNQALEKYGFAERVDHRSLAAQGIDRTPTVHLGPAATAIERRGEVSQKTENYQERQLEVSQKAQAAAAAALEQAQREAAAAAQAQREAQAAAQQQAEQARAQAQAAHDLEIATQAKQEKEDDTIRAAAFDRIGNNVSAAGKDSERFSRLDGFIQSDHADIEKADGAIGRDAEAAKRVLLAAREHLRAGVRTANVNGEVADRIGGNTEIAAKGAERRVARNHLEGCAPAVGDQLGRVGRVLQQASRIFTGIVSTIAAAAQAVTRQIDTRRLEELITQRVADRKAKEAAAKAPEQPTRAAQAPAKADVAKIEEKPPAPPQHPEIDRLTFHTAADKALAERAKALYVSTTPPGEAQRSQLAIDIQTAIIDAVAISRATEPKANVANIDRDTKGEHNREAARAGKMEPWPQGQSNCALLVPAANAKRELEAHQQSGRPLMFGRDKFDDRTAALTSQHKAIEAAAKAAETRLTREVAERTAAARQQDAQNAPHHARAELRIDSLKALEKIAQRERSAMQKPAPGKTRDHGHDRSKSNDFER